MALMTQMQDILAEVNYDFSNVRLVKCLAAHNEAGWIEWNLRNNYDEYDIIRVVEGAVEGRPGATPDGHSTDGTFELIRNFPDPDNKIELYTISRHFKSLEEQKQIFLDEASEGDWIHIVDCDEFYLEGDINKFRQAIHKHPLASEFIPSFLHFFRDFRHIRDFGPEWTINHQRFIRYRYGLRYHTHPVATQADGKCTYFSPEIQPKRYMVPIFVYHYGHAKGKKALEDKRDFYRSELAKFPAGEGGSAADAFDQKFVEFVEYKENLSEILKFTGEHPKIMTEHSAFNYKESFYQDKEIKDFRDSSFYRAYFNRELPTIPQWMWKGSPSHGRMQPFYSWVDI